jgi:hypothetical protein
MKIIHRCTNDGARHKSREPIGESRLACAVHAINGNKSPAIAEAGDRARCSRRRISGRHGLGG